MLTLIVTEEAEQNLIGIGEYTELEWGVLQRKEYLRNIVDRLNWLAENPNHGKQRWEIKQGYFSYPEGKHHIFYLFDKKTITIIGVLHERMDFERYL